MISTKYILVKFFVIKILTNRSENLGDCYNSVICLLFWVSSPFDFEDDVLVRYPWVNFEILWKTIFLLFSKRNLLTRYHLWSRLSSMPPSSPASMPHSLKPATRPIPTHHGPGKTPHPTNCSAGPLPRWSPYLPRQLELRPTNLSGLRSHSHRHLGGHRGGPARLLPHSRSSHRCALGSQEASQVHWSRRAQWRSGSDYSSGPPAQVQTVLPPAYQRTESILRCTAGSRPWCLYLLERGQAAHHRYTEWLQEIQITQEGWGVYRSAVDSRSTPLV